MTCLDQRNVDMILSAPQAKAYENWQLFPSASGKPVTLLKDTQVSPPRGEGDRERVAEGPGMWMKLSPTFLPGPAASWMHPIEDLSQDHKEQKDHPTESFKNSWPPDRLRPLNWVVLECSDPPSVNNYQHLIQRQEDGHPPRGGRDSWSWNKSLSGSEGTTKQFGKRTYWGEWKMWKHLKLTWMKEKVYSRVTKTNKPIRATLTWGRDAIDE